MEEASNLQEGGIYGPSEGGGTPEASVESPADIAPVAVRGAPCTDQGDPVENPQVKPKFWHQWGLWSVNFPRGNIHVDLPAAVFLLVWEALTAEQASLAQVWRLGRATPTPPTLALPLINDTDVGFRVQDECPLGEAVGDGSRGMGLTTLISGYITSAFSTVLPETMVVVILGPAIVPVDFSSAAPPFFPTSPLPHSNTTPETSQSLASLTAS